MKGKADRSFRRIRFHIMRIAGKLLTAEYENERISNQLWKFIPEISADQL